MSTTILDIAKEAYVEGASALLDRKKGVEPARVADGLKPSRAPAREGLHTFTPEELLTLNVAVLEVNGRVIGYQRDASLTLTHARKIARALQDGKPFPEITVALDGRGTMWVVDGQHRALGGVMARIPIAGIVKKMTREEQAELFFGQRQAKTVDRNILILSGSGPFERYIQEAVSNNSNAWSELVSANKTSKTRISPYAMFQLLLRYVGNTEGQAASYKTVMDDRWDRGLADELAPLIACFGNKKTNPFAFRPFAVQAIGSAAVWIFRRSEAGLEERERWLRHMPGFQFSDYPQIRTQIDLTTELLKHWNKRLSKARRVVRP